jgi:predicted ATPase
VIESVHFQNFKSLRDVELTGLQRLTVIVGPTGVGKTSVLQGLNYLHQRHVHDSRGEDFVTHGEETFTIRYVGDDTAIFVNKELDLLGPPTSVWSDDIDWRELQKHPFYLYMCHSVLLEFEAKHLGQPSPATPRPLLARDGSGLATLLAYFAGADRDTLSSIEEALRSIIGVTGRIRTFPHELEVEETENIRIDDQLIPRTTRRKTAAHRFEVEIDELGSIPGDMLSEGTLVTLGLLALLHQSDCPNLILFDDIDVGLHPDAQAKLIVALRKLLDRRPELQILCTSHSPYLLDHFKPQEVQVLSFHDGRVVAARLDQHEDWPKWEGKLQTGEFWQSVGESWVKPPVSSSEVTADAE